MFRRDLLSGKLAVFESVCAGCMVPRLGVSGCSGAACPLCQSVDERAILAEEEPGPFQFPGASREAVPTGRLSFTYGVMNSAKTATLLMALYTAEQGGTQVFLIKPAVDTRDGPVQLTSRVGLSRAVDCVLDKKRRISQSLVGLAQTVFVDEAQFLAEAQVDDLRRLSCRVHCFGLKTDYRQRLFPGARRLLEVADSIREIKTRCSVCPRKATITAKFDAHGAVVREGSDSPDIGDLGKYQIYCSRCYWAIR